MPTPAYRISPPRMLAMLRRLVCGGLLAWLLAVPLAQAAEDTLRVLAWPGYADADFVKTFESRHQVRVELVFIGTDEALWQKMSANEGGDFDVFAVNTAELKRYIDGNLAAPLDLGNIPNTRRQLPRFRFLEAIPGITRAGRVYAVPYTFSEMGIIYDRKQFATPPDSINVLWDTRYRGKVLAYDGGTHNFSLAAQALGFKAPFSLSPQETRQAIDKLIALRRNVLTFYALPEESIELFRQSKAALMFANYGSQQVKLLQAAGADIGYVVPREGALAWLDCWVVSRKARNRKLAEAWINFMLNDEVSAALPVRQGLANTLEQNSTATTVNDRLLWLEPVENPERRNHLWQRIISGDQPGKQWGP